MYRFLFRFAVTSLTILTATLLTTAISDYMVSYKNHYRPLTFTFIGMAIIIVVFYPLFMKMEEWVKAISRKVLKTGKSMVGRHLGLVFTFLAWLLVLFYFYAKAWYHLDFVKILFSGNIRGYF
jgi:hypothetical protein